MKAKLIGVAVSVVASVLSMSPAAAQDLIQIDCGDVAGLIEALNGANANPLNGVTAIGLNADDRVDCTYRLMSAHGSTGDGLPPVSSNVTIDGNSSTIAAAGERFRIFEVVATGGQPPGGLDVNPDFASPASLTLVDLTLTGGNGPNDLLDAKCPELALLSCGGAVYNAGTLSLVDVTVSGNQASYGGGIFNAGSLSLLRTNVSYGNSDREGAGIYSLGDLAIADSSITSNHATSIGGGVVNHGNMIATDTTFAGNSGSNGGGVYTDGVAEVRSSRVLGNAASFPDEPFAASGGGIYAAGMTSLMDSLVEGNSAPFAGGIDQARGRLTVDSSTIRGNHATNGRGGLSVNEYAEATITNSSVTENATQWNFGGGIHNDGDLRVIGSEISGNSAQQGGGISMWTGTTVLSDVSLESNSARGSGGAIYNGSGGLVGNNVSLLDNSAFFGGGIYNSAEQGVVSLIVGSVRGNQAAGSGGGIYNADGSVVATVATEFGGNGPENCVGIVVGC